jgi:hypothetical protein
VEAAKRMSCFLSSADSVIASVTDGGKMSDTIPVELFEHPRRTELSIKNSKLSELKIQKILLLCPQITSLDMVYSLQPIPSYYLTYKSLIERCSICQR